MLKKHNTLLLFVSASALTHLIVWQSGLFDQTPTVTGFFNTKYAINLASPDSQKTSPDPVSRHQKTPARQDITESRDPVSNTAEQTSSFSENRKSQIAISQVISTLRQQLSEHFFYPNMARQRGWEGIVVLKINLLSNGKINSISLEKSSGYRLLDNAAISALQKINHISLSLTSEYTFTLPVIYRLQKG